MVSAIGTPLAEIEPWGPGSPDCAEATNEPYSVSSWIGAVDSICGTWVTVWPPDKSSVCAMSAVDRPLALPRVRADGARPADALADGEAPIGALAHRLAPVVPGLAAARRYDGLVADQADAQVGDVQ